MTIHQDVNLYATLLEAGEKVTHALRPGRIAWAQVASGSVTLNGEKLEAGDGVAIRGIPTLEITGTSSSEVLLFDMTP